MKILAFNCSPRMGNSNTDRILNPLLEAAEATGAEVEKLYARKLKIAPCTGCLTCWFDTPGECVQKDDAVEVREKVKEADLIIWATPIYFFNMTTCMKNVMERVFFPMVLPYFINKGGKIGHPARDQDKVYRTLLVANAGFWGDDVFAPLLQTLIRGAETMVDDEGRSLQDPLGAILVGCGELLSVEPLQEALKPFYAELRSAGEELVREGKLSTATAEKLNAPLFTYLDMEADDALKMINTYFDNVLVQDQEIAKAGG